MYDPRCLMLTVLFFSCIPLAAVDTSLHPTADEILALQMLNDHRREFLLGDMKVTDLIRRKILPGDMISLASQFATGTPLVSPVIINPSLMLAAHAVLKACPVPRDGQLYDCSQALIAAHYEHSAPVFPLIGMEASQLYYAYGNAIIFPYRITDKHVPVFSRQEALSPRWREAGVAVGTAAGKTSLVIILGEGSPHRSCGGVVYSDMNHNGAYDPGEGKAGVVITCGTTTFVTKAGGAWWIDIDQGIGTGEGKPAQIIFSGAGCQAVREVPAGRNPVLIDWRFPLPSDQAMADHLIATCLNGAKSDDQKRMAAAKLFFEARGLIIDDPRLRRIQELVVPVTDEAEMLVSQTIKAFAEEPDEWRKRRAALEKPWQGALRKWFQEADLTYRTYQLVKIVLAAPPDKQSKILSPVRLQVEKVLAGIIDPALIEQLKTWRDQLCSLESLEGPAPMSKNH
jgi:hypothetical protein